MKCLSEAVEHEIIINKSRFICNIKYVKSEEEALLFIKEISTKYNDATHNCYTYLINQTQRANDDGEPSGTAAIPMMEVLNKKELNYIVAVVTRYFGGIKLGGGGLVRAYSHAVSEAISQVQIMDLVPGYEIEVVFSFADSKKVEHIIKQLRIDVQTKEYSQKIKFKLDVTKEELEKLEQLLHGYNHLIEINKKKEIEIIKESNEE